MSDTDSRPLPTEGPTAGGGADEFDDLFNYDADGGANDPFSENYMVPKTKEQREREEARARREKGGDGLGLDEEVEVTRKPRAPRVKLDENRLLSANGIPKLRTKAKHLRFKGKGHEYSDASRLLSFYQLWLDDLFPKARFLDALAMVEKMGHKKRLQMMRMEWINEGKPHNNHEDDEPAPAPKDNEREKTAPRIAPIFETRASERPKTPQVDGDVSPEEDLYGASPAHKPAESNSAPAGSIFGGGASIFSTSKPPAENESLEDDLDALLAEEEEILQATSGNAKTTTAAPATKATHNDFDDEMEAMADMDMEWE